MAEAVLPDGSVIKVPDFALENTQAQMLATLKVLLKGDKETQDLYEKFLDEVKKGNKDTKKSDDKAQKVLEEIKKTNQDQQKSMRKKFADRVEGDVQGVFVGAGRAVSGLATAAVLATGAIIGFGAKIFTGLTDNIRDLTQAGLGFTDSLGNTASSALVQFNSLGYSTQEATQTMLKFASLTATLGRSGPGSLVNTMKSFKALTNNGLDLGMSFKDANEALLEELETRSSLGMLEGSVSSRQLAAANEQIKLQTAYASVLGISADKLREMNKQTLSQNTGLVALMSKFGPQMYEGAAAFNTVMASRGEQLAKVSQLFLDAGAQSSVFISEAARDLASAGVGDITNTLISFGDKLQKGALNSTAAGEAAALQLQQKIGSLNNTQIQNLQKVVEAGGAGAEAAKTILLAYLEVKETERKMAEVARRLGGGMSIDELMKARIKFDNSIAEIKGAFEALATAAMITFTPVINKAANFLEKLAQAFKDDVGRGGRKVRGIGTALLDGLKLIGESLMRLFGFDPAKEMDAANLRKTVVEKIDKFAKAISGAIDSFTKLIETYTKKSGEDAGSVDWTSMFKDIAKQAAAGILTGIAEFIFSLPGMLIDGAKSLLSGPPKDELEKRQSEINSALVSGILKFVGALFAVGMAKSAAALVYNTIKNGIMGESQQTLSQKRTGGLLDRFRGKGGPTPPTGGPSLPGGGPTPGGAPGGAPATLKSVGLDTLKGLGGAVQMLAKGAAGVAVMYLLAKALPELAAGIKSFQDVNLGQLTMAGAALAGMGVALFAASKIFTNPMTIAGLAVFTLGVMGLGKALQWAAPFVKEFAPIVQTLINAIKDTALGLMDTFVKTLERIPEIVRAIGDSAKSVFEGASGLVTSIGTQIQGIIGSIASGIAEVISSIRGADDEVKLMSARTASVKELAGIDPERINNVARAVDALSTSLAKFRDSSGNTFGQLLSNALGGGDMFDRLVKVADSVNRLNALTETLRALSGVIGQTASVIERLSVKPLEDIVTQFSKLWKNLANVELNNKQFYDFAAISTDAMLKNADAINKIAAANRAQNLAYTEFIKLDDTKFAKNVKNAYGYNAANAGATEEGGLAQTVKNVFSSLFGNKPATPVDPSKITPQTPQAKSVTESPLLNALQTPVDKDSLGRTPAEILESVERALKSVIDGGKLKVKE